MCCVVWGLKAEQDIPNGGNDRVAGQKYEPIHPALFRGFSGFARHVGLPFFSRHLVNHIVWIRG